MSRWSRVASAQRPARVTLPAAPTPGTLTAQVVSQLAHDLGMAPEVRLAEGPGDLRVEVSTSQAANADERLHLAVYGRRGVLLLRRDYGKASDLKASVHSFANDVLETLTGVRGVFGSRIAYAMRLGPGRKDIFVTQFGESAAPRRISSGNQVAMLPALGGTSVWYSVMTRQRMFITRTGLNERPLIESAGLNMGVSTCGDRLVFTSTRDGNSEIYSSARDGSDVRRLTHDGGIDVSPQCGPDGTVAFVSDRTGSPQIHVMDGDGSRARRVTFEGNHNQTPTFCGDRSRPKLAFTTVGRTMQVRTLDLRTGAYETISPSGSSAKDPAFSPDCRYLAYATRRGLRVTSLSTRRSHLLVAGQTETVRWNW